MKYYLPFILLLALYPLPAKPFYEINNATIHENHAGYKEKNQTGFIENKGQITDQHGKFRKDIDVKLEGNNVQVFIGEGGMHYQWNTSLSGEEGGVIETYRMDVELVGANKNAELVLEKEQDYTEHYYLAQCPNGIVAKSYKKITYKNIYPNIDWVIYIENQKSKVKSQTPIATGAKPGSETGQGFKYDFIVHPGGNPKDIQLRYAGATELKLKDGALEAVTPFGSTREDAPYCYTMQNEKEKIKKQNVVSAYRLADNVLSFDMAAYEGTLIIDPELKWATYYGGSGDDNFYDVATDAKDNAYACGMTASLSNIATTGSYQVNIGGNIDGMVVKFDSSGQRLWATYYGGTDVDNFLSIVADSAGNNIYIAGSTHNTGLATSGTQQQALSGLQDGLLVKLNGSGGRIWASYYGGTGYEGFGNISLDANGNIVFCGQVDVQGSNIATAGAYRTTATDFFFGKFSPTGSRLWCSYFTEYIRDVTCDRAGNFYFCGGASAAFAAITTTGAYQASSNGLMDGYIVRMNAAGTAVVWATYIGGNQGDALIGIGCDAAGNVYAGGETQSTTGIASSNGYKQALSGSRDAYFVKFSPAGALQWSTYYGGNGIDNLSGISVARNGNMYAKGATNSTSGIATTGSYNGGAHDAYLVKFSSNGAPVWATYVGGNGNEPLGQERNIASNERGRVYVAGTTTSTSGLATTGAYQATFGGGGSDGMLASFIDTLAFFLPPFTDTVFCAGDSIFIPYGISNRFNANNVFTLQLSDANGSFANAMNIGSIAAAMADTIPARLPPATAGGAGYRLRIMSSSPADSSFDNEVNIRIKPLPSAFSAGNDTTLCAADSLKLTANATGSGITWQWTGPGGFSSGSEDTVRVVQYADSGAYIVTATLDGCAVTDTIQVKTKPLPAAFSVSSNSPVCPQLSLNLTGNTSSAGVTWLWSGPGGYVSTSQNPVRNNMTAAEQGNYTGKATLNGCSISGTIPVQVMITTPTPSAGSNSPVCVGGAINLTSSTVAGATYEWGGPGIFSSTQQNPSINIAQIADGGKYFVTAIINGCRSLADTVAVSVIQGPSVLIYPNPGDTICPGWDVTFVAIPQNAGGSPAYAWYKNGSSTGGTNVTFKTSGVADGDSFYVQMTAGSACNTPISSKPLRMTVLPVHTPPTISISADPGAHVWPYVPVTFKAKTGNSGAHPGYQWRRNGADIPNANDSVWVSSDLKTGDTICCVVTSNFLCAVPREVQSNCLVMNVDVGVNSMASRSGVHVYPNPVHDELVVEGAAAGSVLQLFDITGREILQATLTGTRHSIAIGHLAKGTYLLYITGKEGNRISRKVVKE